MSTTHLTRNQQWIIFLDWAITSALLILGFSYLTRHIEAFMIFLYRMFIQGR